MAEAFYRANALVCGGTGCVASGSTRTFEAMKAEIAHRGLEDEVRAILIGCRGFCEMGPVMIIYPEGIFYCRVREEDIPHLVEETFIKGRVVEALTYKEPMTHQSMPHYSDIPFYAKQQRIALSNCGMIDPENIEEYIARGGYEALGKAIFEMTQEEVIEEVKRSGLRGRGGAGFLAGLKWKFTYGAPGDVKYVVCNADEGDPGAFMDRSLLEGDPHSLLEGMMIAAYAIGARDAYIYCRAEYPLAIHRLRVAIAQAEEYGLSGSNVLGTDFSFHPRIKEGAGAFVCGEETALIASIEGRRGEPRPRPPFPAVKGLWGKPTSLNNVKSYANIPRIITMGADWFSSIGTPRSPGTAIFALTGNVNNTGLIEVPMGITMGEIVFDIGGGIPGGKQFKAVQTGGPLGGCLPAQHLNLPVDFDSLKDVGAVMGSGGMIVVDEDTCMVEFSQFFLRFATAESCGKCVPCRVGGKRMLEVLTRIIEGRGRLGDIETIKEIAVGMDAGALCALGQLTPNPVLSTIRYFREEYEAHIIDKKCPAGVCKPLVASHALEDKCLPCLEAVAGYDAGGYRAFRATFPELVSERLVTKLQTSGCVVDLARFSMIVPAQNKSCTKCLSCRLGTAQVVSLLNDIAAGNGKLEMLDLLFELSGTMKLASECPVGQTAPDVVLFTLEHFREQYEEHILDKHCPGSICGKDIFYHTTCPLKANSLNEVIANEHNHSDH